jgi:hypothetical protein
MVMGMAAVAVSPLASTTVRCSAYVPVAGDAHFAMSVLPLTEKLIPEGTPLTRTETELLALSLIAIEPVRS